MRGLRNSNGMRHELRALFEILFDIIRLRKGPDAIPYSPLLFLVMAIFWLATGLVMTLAADDLDLRGFVLGTMTGIAGLGCYAALLVIAGKAPRLVQTMSAVLGCGALLGLIFVAGNALLSRLASADVASLVTTLILLWSIPVEGHIIARAIDRHWYVGVVAAMAVFVFQLFLYSLIAPTGGQAT